MLSTRWSQSISACSLIARAGHVSFLIPALCLLGNSLCRNVKPLLAFLHLIQRQENYMMHTLQMWKMFNGVWWLHIEPGVPLIRLAVLHNGSAQPIVDRAFTLFVSISLEFVIRKVKFCPIRLPQQS